MTATARVADRLGWLPRATAWLLTAFFLVGGIWAMVAPESFFERLADFPPYNQHLLQDIGAFQLGLAAMLLAALTLRPSDALLVALAGGAVASVAHWVSHVIGRDLGGNSETDLPALGLLALIAVVATAVRWRQVRAAA